jgi:maltose O-acetyltransferase
VFSLLRRIDRHATFASVRRSTLRTAIRCTPSTRIYPLRNRLFKMQGLHVDSTARITSSAIFLLEQVKIGPDTFIGHHFRAYGSVESHLIIGKRCDIGPEVSVLAGTHHVGNAERRAGRCCATDVLIGDGAWIGGRASIIGPCVIGAGSIVAAGAIVRSDVPDNHLYFGPRSTDLKPLNND